MTDDTPEMPDTEEFELPPEPDAWLAAAAQKIEAKEHDAGLVPAPEIVEIVTAELPEGHLPTAADQELLSAAYDVCDSSGEEHDQAVARLREALDELSSSDHSA